MTWVLLPTTLKPFQNRDVWVRFFDHEEAVKIVLPYRQRIHVYDVKKIALKEMDAGYTSHNPENVRLLSDVGNGLLRPDEVWDNALYHSSAYYPILAVETRYELFSYLNRTLGCFSDIRAFGNNIYEIKFQPQFNDYQPLSYVLHSIHRNTVTNWQVQYLRRAFNDPLKDVAHNNAEYWSRPKDVLQDSQPWYVHPQPSMMPNET
ncbi:hypothetical protein BGZ72_001931 [Mortierella alpina]|nr:hypothetical protein BGZ72_001931 [Mortierella alpina]